MRTKLLIAALGAAAALGQNALWMDLSGPWHRTNEDRPEFASPGFDHSRWETWILPPAVNLRPAPGQFWLRKTVTLPEGTDRGQLALTLGTFSDDYEVFVNGLRIGGTGGTSARNSRIPRPLTFEIPPEAAPGGPLTVAIHAWNWGARSSGTLRLEPAGPFLLTYRHQAAPRIGSDYMALRRARYTPNGILGALLLGLVLLLVVVWTGQRERGWDLLCLAAAVASETSVVLVRYMAIGEDTVPWSVSRFTVLAPSLTSASLAVFAAATFQYHQRWVWTAIGAAWSMFPLGYLVASPGTSLPISIGVLAVVTLGLIGVAWWRDGAWRQPRAQHLFVLALLLVVLERPTRFFVSNALAEWTIGPYRADSSALVLLFLTSVITARILQRVRLDALERQRLAGELQAARLVQQFFLTPGHAADGGPWSIATAYEPAQEVGGDFYQIFPLGDGGTLIAVGDVSGKGLKAAMVVSLVTGALRNRRPDDPAELLGELNRAVAGSLDSGFVTAAIARFHPDGRVTLANAGNPAPYLDGKEIPLDAGLPLGLTQDSEYSNHETRVEPGGQLTFVSDGAVEAANATGELFGFDRTREISTQSAAEIAEAARAWGQNDDITVVTVRRASA